MNSSLKYRVMAMFSPQKNSEFDDGRIGFKAHFGTTLKTNVPFIEFRDVYTLFLYRRYCLNIVA